MVMNSSSSSISSISATNSEEISAICDEFLELSISEEKSDKMVKVVVESFGDLSNKEYWDEECSLCSMPTMLHKGSCSRKTEVGEAEHSDLWKSWSLFRKKMEPIRKWYKEEMDKKLMNSELLKGLQEMTAANQKGIQEMTAAIMSGNKDRPNKLVKPAKVPSWNKGMKLEAYEKSLQVWMEMNKDLSEAVRY